MLITPIFGFKKPELSDSPPDITVLNYNWDLIEQFIQARIEKAMIANNLVTTAEGFVLDARQGKNLQDQITAQNENLVLKMTTNKTHLSTSILAFSTACETNTSIMCIGTYTPSDSPFASGSEFMIEVLVGDNSRKIIKCISYGGGVTVYKRSWFAGTWLESWLLM